MPSSTPRDTSLEAYNHIVNTGLLGKTRTKAYRLLYRHGPLAQFEVEEFEGQKHYGGSLSKRFSELEDIGAVQIIGKKKNPISGRNCNLYDVTSKLITQPYQSKTSPAQKAAHLRRYLKRLSTQNTARRILVDKVIDKILSKMDQIGL